MVYIIVFVVCVIAVIVIFYNRKVNHQKEMTDFYKTLMNKSEDEINMLHREYHFKKKKKSEIGK